MDAEDVCDMIVPNEHVGDTAAQQENCLRHGVADDCRKKGVAEEVEAALVQLFSHCGELVSVRLGLNTKDNKLLGYAFLTFAKPDAVELAVQHHGEEFLGKQIVVSADTSPTKKHYT